jgi:hypothetical protein
MRHCAVGSSFRTRQRNCADGCGIGACATVRRLNARDGVATQGFCMSQRQSTGGALRASVRSARLLRIEQATPISSRARLDSIRS